MYLLVNLMIKLSMLQCA